MLFLALITLGLGPIWAFRYFPTQDGPSHLLNARVFKQCVQPGTTEAQFYERRLAPIPNWTAAALLNGLTDELPPFVAEKALVSIYAVGLPLAVDYFLAVLDATGASTLALLFVWNSCLMRGFYSYGLGLAILFLTLGWFLRREAPPGAGDTAILSVLLLFAYFTHLAIFLIAVFCLAWFVVNNPEQRPRRLGAIMFAATPAGGLTLHYLVSTGFFGTPEVSSALDIAKEEARGTLLRLREAPAVLFRELFPTHPEGWLAGLVVLSLALWLWGGEDGNAHSPKSRRLRRSILWLSLVLLVLFALIPDTLRAHGGFLKSRLAPVALLLAIGAIRSAPRGRIGARHLPGVGLVLVNLYFVFGYVGQLDREIEDFTAGVAWVRAGETLVSVKGQANQRAVVDPFFSEYYCIARDAVCLSSYEAGTEHFPVKLRSGAKHRIRQNRPGSFWADVVLGWDASDDAVPQPDEPYLEVFRRGKLRLFRRLRPEP